MEDKDWFKFQEDICSHFISIGASAKTNVTVQGVRTKHDVDVLVKTKFLGEDLTWIVEAKKWKSKVSKDKVLTLRTIADDIGVNKAFIISEAGFQLGAYEAAENSNVALRTFEDLKRDTREFVEAEIIKFYKKRLELLEIRYYSHSKKMRKKYGLRDEIWDFPIQFSGFHLLLTAHRAIKAAEVMDYPIDLETNIEEKNGDLFANNFQQLTNWLNVNMNYFEEKMLRAEDAMMKNGDFRPVLNFGKNDFSLNIEKIASYLPDSFGE